VIGTGQHVVLDQVNQCRIGEGPLMARPSLRSFFPRTAGIGAFQPMVAGS
jgi:hypothetical protein